MIIFIFVLSNKIIIYRDPCLIEVDEMLEKIFK